MASNANITTNNSYSRAGSLQIINEFPGDGSVCASSTKEDESPGATGYHPFAETSTEASETTDHEIALFRGESGFVLGGNYHNETLGILERDYDLANTISIGESAEG